MSRLYIEFATLFYKFKLISNKVASRVKVYPANKGMLLLYKCLKFKSISHNIIFWFHGFQRFFKYVQINCISLHLFDSIGDYDIVVNKEMHLPRYLNGGFRTEWFAAFRTSTIVVGNYSDLIRSFIR